MKIITNTYHYIIFVFILLSVSVLFMFYLQPIVFAEPSVLPAGEITGWGWTDTFGWISLNCVNVYAGENQGTLTNAHCLPSPNEYGVKLNEETGVVSGQAWSTNAGWIDFDPIIGTASVGSLPDVMGGDDYPYTVRMEVATRYLEGWAVAIFDDTDPNNNAWIRFRAGEDCVTGPLDAITEDNYCVRLNENGYLAGWAWSGGQNGLGWIRFDQDFSGGPYIKTQYSDIYSGGTVTGSRAPEGVYNATYCIISGGVSDITLSSSQSCLIGGVSIDFPDSEQNYSTSIVRIDIDSLKLIASSDDRYYDVEGVTPYSITELPNNSSLGGLVYYFTSSTGEGIDFQINNILRFSDAIGPGDLGSGTIVVDGDLYINSNLSYTSGTPDKLSDIASVAWIVLGDVYVDKSVEDVVGTFVVLGNGSAGSGKFYTGDDELDETPLPLQFKGMIVAKGIVLERTYFEGLAPAEIFDYDGRVLINTPLGLGNFIGYLPDWSR